MGLLANETYGYRIFSGDKKFAELCRCSVKSLQRARQQMIDDGFLALVKPATGQKVAEYQFIFKKVGGQNVQPLEEVGGHPVQVGGHPVQSRWTSGETTPIYVIKEESKESNSPASVQSTDVQAKPFEVEFETLWKVYPRKIGKKSAYTKVVAQLRKGVSFDELLRATENYAQTRVGQAETYTMHPDTFYGSSNRFEDYLSGGAGLEENTTKTMSKSELALAEFKRRREGSAE